MASLGLATGPAAAASADRWTGASSSPNWSDATNWSPSAPAPGDDLVFPELSGCDATVSTCYTSNNDEVTGFPVNSVTLPAAADANLLYSMTGNPFTLGAGGLTDKMDLGNTASIDSIILGASQSWTVEGGGSLNINNPLTTTSPTNTFGVTLGAGNSGDNPTLNFFGDNETGPAAFTGSDSTKTGSTAGNNGIVLFSPDSGGTAGMNAGNSSPLTFTNVEFTGGGSYSGVTMHGGQFTVGDQTAPGDANKKWIVQPSSLTLDHQTLVDEPISGPATGTPTAGTDYGQIKSADAVDLGNAQLAIENFGATARFCPALNTSYTLVTGGSVTGQFSDANGATIPDGGVVPLTCPDTSGNVGLSIHYTSTAVTATAVNPPSGTSSSVSTTTNDPTQPATATNGGYTATGSGGTGTVIVSTYGGDPTPSQLPGSTGNFFDVRLQSGSTFTKLVETVDSVASDATLSWFNPATSSWEKVVGDPGPTVSGGKLTVTLDANSSPNLTQLSGTAFGVASASAKPVAGISRYRLFASDGGVFNFNAAFFGSMGATPLNQPIVGGATASDGNGYYEVARDGGVFSFGPGAHFAGSTGGIKLTQPIVGMAIDPATGGYWLVGADGGVFSFNAPYFGSTGGQKLNQPIVGITASSDGQGYYLVARDGGVFTFGPSAKFQGSTGATKLNQPIVGITPDPLTGGYWLVAADGGVFSFNAPFQGSTGGMKLNKPIVAMTFDPASGGYWMVATDGGVFSFNAPFQGSTGGMTLAKPVVAIAGG